jgi:hypothetical protein
MVCLALMGCSPSISHLQERVKTSLQNKLDEASTAEYGLKVENVTLIHMDGKSYQGMAVVKFDGQDKDVLLHVVADSKNLIWTTDPGALDFIAQAKAKEAAENFEENIKKIQASINAAASQTASAAMRAESAPTSVANQTVAGAPATGPSFDCAKATHIDSLMICGSPKLSALDRAWAQHYAEEKSSANATELKTWHTDFLTRRRACGGRVDCIARVYQGFVNSKP